jgi:hypothetical protein
MTFSAARIGLWLGPTLALILLAIGPPDGLTQAAWACAALLVLMAIWWATEAIPIAVTALLPLAVLPLFGVSTPKAIAQSYADPIVLLLMAGFMIALGPAPAHCLKCRGGDPGRRAHLDCELHGRNGADLDVDIEYGDHIDDAADCDVCGGCHRARQP